MEKLHGREVDVFVGDVIHCCIITSGYVGTYPFCAQCQYSSFTYWFSASVAKQLRNGTAPNMKLV